MKVGQGPNWGCSAKEKKFPAADITVITLWFDLLLFCSVMMFLTLKSVWSCYLVFGSLSKSNPVTRRYVTSCVVLTLFFMGWDLGHQVLVQPQMINEGDCGAIGGMKIGRGNRSTRRKPAPAPFCPPKIPLDQPRVRTRAAAMGSQRLTAWAMALPLF
jgi:hypothetical protein